MYSKLNSRHSKSVYVTFFLIASFVVSTAQASTWAEVGDAGNLLGSAQIPVGNVTSITGVALTTLDVDLYKIFISDPTTFSASVSGGDGSGEYDSALALFDQDGLGVYANDDVIFNNGQAALPASYPLGPQVAGTYYLAIFDIDSAPTSGNASSSDTSIFPQVGEPYTQIVGSTGAGGASPLTGWEPFESALYLNEGYSIALTGVSPIPEPESYAMLLAGLGLLGTIVRRRKISSNELGWQGDTKNGS